MAGGFPLPQWAFPSFDQDHLAEDRKTTRSGTACKESYLVSGDPQRHPPVRLRAKQRRPIRFNLI
jgi:hypothetical protein